MCFKFNLLYCKQRSGNSNSTCNWNDHTANMYGFNRFDRIKWSSGFWNMDSNRIAFWFSNRYRNHNYDFRTCCRNILYVHSNQRSWLYFFCINIRSVEYAANNSIYSCAWNSNSTGLYNAYRVSRS